MSCAYVHGAASWLTAKCCSMQSDIVRGDDWETAEIISSCCFFCGWLDRVHSRDTVTSTITISDPYVGMAKYCPELLNTTCISRVHCKMMTVQKMIILPIFYSISVLTKDTSTCTALYFQIKWFLSLDCMHDPWPWGSIMLLYMYNWVYVLSLFVHVYCTLSYATDREWNSRLCKWKGPGGAHAWKNSICTMKKPANS